MICSPPGLWSKEVETMEATETSAPAIASRNPKANFWAQMCTRSRLGAGWVLWDPFWTRSCTLLEWGRHQKLKLLASISLMSTWIRFDGVPLIRCCLRKFSSNNRLKQHCFCRLKKSILICTRYSGRRLLMIWCRG